jgi:multiple sugar transport system permease protein
MKGFFDGISPESEYAAYIDGCSRWGAFFRIALPMATPGIVALFILSWLYTWNEFLFALILTGSRTTMLTVRMAQFVHETGIEWHLMSATAVMAIGPALIVTLFAQEYVVKGLKI